MKQIKLVILAIISIVVTSCSLDFQENPNAATPEAADINLLLNGVQFNFYQFATSAQNQPMGATRMILMGGVYNNAFSSVGFDGKWRNAYSGVLADAETLNGIIGNEPIYNNVRAVNKILSSYTLTTLVDYFGDVPYTEAIKFTQTENPKVDLGKDVYTAALKMLDEAINDINNNTGSDPLGGDMYYGGDMAKWRKLAKTLKLRIYNNTRLVDANAKSAMNSLISENDLINSSSDDFVWRYGTNNNDPDVRSDRFVESLTRSSYMGQYFMNVMKNGSPDVDPRIYYYFYRQSGTYPGTDAQGLFDRPCQKFTKPAHYSASAPYCNSIGDGYWGRDHGNNEGVPSDNNRITIWGLYPYGTKFDNNSFSSLGQNDGAQGAGYFPIMMSSWVSFMKAEASITLGVNGSAKDYFIEGLNRSLNTVKDFNTAIPTGNNVMTSTSMSNFVTVLSNTYDNTTSNEEKLNLIMKQFYIAVWGNGLESFNNYRRTGYPSDIQPNLESAPGNFISTFKYPAAAVTNNSNISQKPDQNVKVFWDTQTAVNVNF